MLGMRWFTDRFDGSGKLAILEEDKVRTTDFPFPPYFYVRDPVTNKLEKIECDTPKKVRELSHEIIGNADTFESDIPYPRRVCMDLGWHVTPPSNFLIYDIEVEASDAFPDPEQALYRITCICAIDKYGKEYTFCDDDEWKMVQDFLKLAMKYRVTAGWNSMRFDYQYLRNRVAYHLEDIKVDWFQIIDIDLLPSYRFVTLVEKESFALDAIAKVEGIGQKTLHIGDNVKEFSRLFKEDKPKLIEYCLNDVKLAHGIEAKYALIQIVFTLCESCYIFPGDLFYLDENKLPRMTALPAVETICMRKANAKGIRIRTKHEQPKPVFEGGIVMRPPKKGVVDNVAVLDFKSLYPNIIRAFNIGPDTFIGNHDGAIKSPMGSYRDDVRSYIAEAIDELMHLKDELGEQKGKLDKNSDEYKAMIWKYHSTKVVINSLFGVMGFYRSRLYKYECCADVMYIERVILPKLIDITLGMGYEVVGADTDSVFVVIPSVEEAEELSETLTLKIREFIKDYFHITNGSEKYFNLEMDKYFHRVMIIAKKKYAGIVIHEGGPCMYYYKRGLESARHDWPQATRDFQDKLLKTMLNDGDYKAYIRTTKEKVVNGKLDDQLAVYKTYKKDFDDYNVKPPHVRAAKMLMDKGAVLRVGDKVGYFKVGERKEDIIPVVKSDSGAVLNTLTLKARAFIWKKQFEPIIERFAITSSSTLSSFMEEDTTEVVKDYRGDMNAVNPDIFAIIKAVTTMPMELAVKEFNTKMGVMEGED